MIKIENVDVFGWQAAIRGMRNPLNSWDKRDSYFGFTGFQAGEKDLKLMTTLSKAGSDHGKFLRMINVTLDITAPLYWWKEFDTYKVGTVVNACSTMHKIHDKEFGLDDFSHEHLFNDDGQECHHEKSIKILEYLISILNYNRMRFLATNDKQFWWQLIQLLPSSYNQKRTIQLNYQVLKSMYFARRNHKLDEWVEFCNWIETLPYAKELILNEIDEN